MTRELKIGSAAMHTYENIKRFAHTLIELEARRIQTYGESFEPSWKQFGKRDSTALREQLLHVNQRERTLLAIAQNPFNDIALPEGLESRLAYTLKLAHTYQQETLQLHRSFLDAEADFLRKDGSITPLLLTCEKLIAHLEKYAKEFGPHLRADDQRELDTYRFNQQIDITQENLIQPLHDSLTTLRTLFTRQRERDQKRSGTLHWE
jgi:hypothetical protein